MVVEAIVIKGVGLNFNLGIMKRRKKLMELDDNDHES